ncbi:MAG: ubiquinone/menaquinone biosynthesis methyltransferase [Anaerolineales bacterium]
MTHLSGAERARYVQSMFARIAGRYDLMNRLMTGGQDVRWRRQVIALAQLPHGGRLLDLGTGTGDLALEALRCDPAARAVGGDFTLEMMRVGRARPGGNRVHWAGTDALNLPFPQDTFDAVTSGYLMRNVVDVRRAWAEQYRVLKPGGRVVCLDTTPPPRNVLRPFINFHLHVIIPKLGRLVAGASDAYTYLPDSTENFLPAEALAERMAEAGFKEVQFRRLMFGTMAIHWGRK